MQKSALLRSISDLTRDEFVVQIKSWLESQSDDNQVAYAQFLDLKNIDKFFTIIFSDSAAQEFDIPESDLEINVIGLIIDFLIEELCVHVDEATGEKIDLRQVIGDNAKQLEEILTDVQAINAKKNEAV